MLNYVQKKILLPVTCVSSIVKLVPNSWVLSNTSWVGTSPVVFCHDDARRETSDNNDDPSGFFLKINK